MSRCISTAVQGSPISTVAELGTYLTRVCFKHGPPRRTGLELEWLLVDPADPRRRPEVETLLTALGPHAPRTLSPDSPMTALPGGGLVSVEPGGQVELSSTPFDSVAALVTAMTTDISALRALLAPSGFVFSDSAADPHRPPHRILAVPRYDAMAGCFDAIGPAGQVMMCSTAATQVCLDLGTSETAAERWCAAHYLGPVLLAAFANSPRTASPFRPAMSTRMSSWWRLDPARTAPPRSWALGDYVERVLDTQVLARRRPNPDWRVRRPFTLRQWAESGEPLDTADVDLHLSMMFPPVRPQGYLEIRYLDAQPDGQWVVPLALLATLFRSPASVRQVLDCCSEAAQRWQQGTELGLADPVLRRCAGGLLELVRPGLAALELDAGLADLVEGLLGRRLGDAISPAMEDLEANQLMTEGSR